ncbi:MAG: hypothetical protein WCH35_13175 [Comamonadaceae bacterium]
MKIRLATVVIAGCAFCAAAGVSFDAAAQSEASALSGVSALPLASLVEGSVAASQAALAAPLALSTAGAVLVVKAVEVSARGTVYVLERVSDGARASVEVVGKTVSGVSVVAGTVVTVALISAGVVLSVAGQVIAFVPNELGRALLHSQRVTP